MKPATGFMGGHSFADFARLECAFPHSRFVRHGGGIERTLYQTLFWKVPVINC